MKGFGAETSDRVNEDFTVIVVHGCPSEKQFNEPPLSPAGQQLACTVKGSVSLTQGNLRIPRVALQDTHQCLAGGVPINLPAEKHFDQELLLRRVRKIHGPSQSCTKRVG